MQHVDILPRNLWLFIKTARFVLWFAGKTAYFNTTSFRWSNAR